MTIENLTETNWNEKVERPRELIYENGLVITAGLVRSGEREAAKEIVEALVTNFPEKILNKKGKKQKYGGDK